MEVILKMSRYSGSKHSVLKDNSWIKKHDSDDEDIDRDPNFGKSILNQRPGEKLARSEAAEESKTTKPLRPSSSVHALSKKFGGGQDEWKSSTLPSSKTTSSPTKSTYSSLKSDSPKTTTTTKVTKDGNTETTTITTTKSLKSPVAASPTKTFTEQVKSSSKGAQYSPYSPTKTTKVTETSVTSKKDAEDKLFDTLIPSPVKDDYSTKNSKRTVTTTEIVTVKSSADNDAEDKLYDTLIPSSIKNDYSPKDSKTAVSSTEIVTVKSIPDGDSIKTTTTKKTSSKAEDALYDTLLPSSITSPVSSPVSSTSVTKREIITVESSKGVESPTPSSPSITSRTTSYSLYTDDVPSTRTTSYTISTKPSDDYTSDRKTYSYTPSSSYEYSSITSPTVYTTTSYRSSRSDDVFTDPVYSTSSMKSVYASPERTVLEKDLCTVCRKPFTSDAKMVLDDMKINCHAYCFKCQVCSSTLGNMKAGDSLWVYRGMVHCDNCFERTKAKWRI